MRIPPFLVRWHGTFPQPAASQESPQLTGKEREAEAKREPKNLGGQVFGGRPNWHIEDPTKATKQQSSLNFGATENDTGQVFEVLFCFSALFFPGSMSVSIRTFSKSCNHQWPSFRFYIHVSICFKQESYPIGSMGLVYVPTWMVDFYGKLVGSYTIFYGKFLQLPFSQVRNLKKTSVFSVYRRWIPTRSCGDYVISLRIPSFFTTTRMTHGISQRGPRVFGPKRCLTLSLLHDWGIPKNPNKNSRVFTAATLTGETESSRWAWWIGSVFFSPRLGGIHVLEGIKLDRNVGNFEGFPRK